MRIFGTSIPIPNAVVENRTQQVPCGFTIDRIICCFSSSPIREWYIANRLVLTDGGLAQGS